MDKTSANATEAQTEPAHRGAFTWLLWFFILLFVVYPLSIGPAAKFCQIYPAAEPPLNILYQPLGRVAAHCPPVFLFLRWYCNTIWKVQL
jgi:hypothetical protein